MKKDAAEIREKFRHIISLLVQNGLTVSAMESCTGGLISSLLTDIPGASDAVKGGLVTYSNASKIHYGVPAEVIDTFGVYSPQCAAAMAEAVRKECGTDIGLGITGSLCTVDRNNKDSVPGTVYAALKRKEEEPAVVIMICADEPERYLCKLIAADAAADLLIDVLDTYQ